MFTNFTCPKTGRPVYVVPASASPDGATVTTNDCAWCRQPHSLPIKACQIFNTEVAGIEAALGRPIIRD